MKKILSLVLVLAMLASSCMLLASCAKVSEKKAAADPFGVIANAFEISLSDFFTETKKVNDVIGKASKKGACNLVVATDLLDDGKLLQLDETLYIDTKKSAAVSESKITSGGKTYRYTVWADKEGLAVQSESLFGIKDTLSLNFDRFIEEFDKSALNKMLGLSSSLTQMLTDTVKTVSSSFDEKAPLIPEEEAEEMVQKIYEILNQKITAEKIAIGDAKEADHIVISYTLTPECILEFCELAIDMADKHEISLGNYDAQKLEESLAAAKKMLQNVGDLELNMIFYIQAKSGALSQMDLELNYRPADKKMENTSADVSVIFSEDQLSVVGNVYEGKEKYELDAAMTKATKGDKTTYEINAEATAGNVHIDLLNATYVYNKKSGNMEIDGKLSLNRADSITFDLDANLNIEKKSFTFSVESLNLRDSDEELLDFKKDRNNELSLTLKTIDELPALDEDAKDIMDVSREEWTNILDHMSKQFEEDDVEPDDTFHTGIGW